MTLIHDQRGGGVCERCHELPVTASRPGEPPTPSRLSTGDQTSWSSSPARVWLMAAVRSGGLFWGDGSRLKSRRLASLHRTVVQGSGRPAFRALERSSTPPGIDVVDRLATDPGVGAADMLRRAPGLAAHRSLRRPRHRRHVRRVIDLRSSRPLVGVVPVKCVCVDRLDPLHLFGGEGGELPIAGPLGELAAIL